LVSFPRRYAVVEHPDADTGRVAKTCEACPGFVYSSAGAVFGACNGFGNCTSNATSGVPSSSAMAMMSTTAANAMSTAGGALSVVLGRDLSAPDTPFGGADESDVYCSCDVGYEGKACDTCTPG